MEGGAVCYNFGLIWFNGFRRGDSNVKFTMYDGQMDVMW